jgi:flagella basal body P-ring formation protein FlgA
LLTACVTLVGFGASSARAEATAFSGPSASGLEIRLKPAAEEPLSVVRLGDIAEIMSADPQEAERLALIELFPAPGEGQVRWVSLREVQDVLELHGMNLARCRLYGSSSVCIRAGTAAPDRPTRGKMNPADRQRAQRLVHAAVLRQLGPPAVGQANWTVEPRLSAGQLEVVSRASSTVVTQGPESRSAGLHHFQLTATAPDGVQTLTVPVEITRPTMVVTAIRPLRRGELIQAADVELSPAPANVQLAAYASQLEDVIGRETDRSVAAGQAISLRQTRAPLLVRRGDVVTVFARAAGIRVRTTARAMEDGSHGQLIMVQTLTGRERYSARVVDVQEVEVYPRAVRVPATRDTSSP